MPSLLEREIADACGGTAAGTTARMQALAKVRWVLATENGMFVMVDSVASVRLTDHLSEATIYDGRDNEILKCRFMERILTVPLCVVLLENE